MLIAAASENVALPLELQVNPILKYTTPRLDIWKVLLGDGRVKLRVESLRLLRRIHVECAVLRVKRGLGGNVGMTDTGDDKVLVLCLSRTFAERLRGLLILTKLITLLDLSLQLLREFSLPGLLIVDRVSVQRGLSGELLTAHDRQMVLVAVASTWIDRLGWVDN